MNIHGILAITRHAESEWNSLGKWTGLTDVDITEKGAADAYEVGKLLRDMSFDAVYTSEQRRTHQTLEGILKGSEHGEVPQYIHGAINERDYGSLTGKNKWEVQEEIGDTAFKGIRRGWDYPVPGGETLKDVYERVAPFFDKEILPQLKRGENVLMVAHGNSLRALMKHLEDIHEDEMANVEMPFGHVHLYHVNTDGSIAHKQTRAIETGPINA